jgi:putative colanic acid biosynthesis UDP-glucose lipid carrier transferase
MFDAVKLLPVEETPPGSASKVTPAAVGRSISKRSFDILVALVVLLFVAPVLIGAALAVWVESGGPVLFRQRRTGYKGERFVILKFRTMNVLEDGAVLKHATRDDARVTRVGAFLRKTSIDELPQLFNVLRGDMSLVGPRPHALAHDEYYASRLPDYNLRFQARPGLTGLAQVSGLRGEVRALDAMARRVEADIDYIGKWSPALDLKIMARTVPLIFHDPAAY